MITSLNSTGVCLTFVLLWLLAVQKSQFITIIGTYFFFINYKPSHTEKPMPSSETYKGRDDDDEYAREIAKTKMSSK